MPGTPTSVQQRQDGDGSKIICALRMVLLSYRAHPSLEELAWPFTAAFSVVKDLTDGCEGTSRQRFEISKGDAIKSSGCFWLLMSGYTVLGNQHSRTPKWNSFGGGGHAQTGECHSTETEARLGAYSIWLAIHLQRLAGCLRFGLCI